MLSYQGLPPLDIRDGLMRAWWFDPLTATVSFGAFINLYWYHERKRGLSSQPEFTETVSLGFGPLFNSATAYWLGIFIWKLLVPPAAPYIPDGIPYNATELAYLAAEVTTGIFTYDALFFAVHWAMHESPILRQFHARHHDRRPAAAPTAAAAAAPSVPAAARTLESRDTLRHGLLDGSLQVLINILVQRQNPWGCKSRAARALHNIIVIWMLVESHTSSPAPYIWRRWCVGVREHPLHHLGVLKQGTYRYGKHHRHQQFFGYLDNLRAWWNERQWRIVGVRVQKKKRQE
jgi:hypothetical protein